MEVLIEIVVYIFAELVASLIGEGVCEVASRSSGRQRGRGGKIAWYLMLGAAVGALSLVVLPSLFLAESSWRLLNLLVTPLIAGLVMMMLGKWRRRRGDRLVPLDHFTYGYLFALTMAIVRVAFGGR